jgi:AAA domain
MMSVNNAHGEDQAPNGKSQSRARGSRKSSNVNRQRRKKAADDPDGGPRSNRAGVAGKNGHSYPLQHWLNRTDIPKPEPLLGHLLTATDRGLLIGPPGLGKTMFMLAFGMAVASGQSFLHWKGTGQPKRVLYIDGEMPRNVVIDRLQNEVRRLGSVPETFWLLSKEDWPDMPPIIGQSNGVVVGTDYLDNELDIHKPDLVIFDNIQSLLIGDMTKEDAWALVLPWTKRLTQRNIAQMWVHHTGHDESRGYGTKTKEWTVDHVVVLKRNKETEKDGKVLTFDLTFTKKADEQSGDIPGVRAPDSHA